MFSYFEGSSVASPSVEDGSSAAGWEAAEVSGENSISSDSRLFDSSNCIIPSSSSRYSALRVSRSLFSLPPDEQQMPESSEPKLDWSKLGEEVDVVIDTPPVVTTRDSIVAALAVRTGLQEAESGGRTTGSALPHTLLNLRAKYVVVI